MGRADVSLNERGRWQAQRLAESLASHALHAIYSSPLLRALDSAQLIAQRHGLEVQTEPGLIEMDIGKAEGLPYAEARRRFPAHMGAYEGAVVQDPGDAGGELIADVQRRALITLESLAAAHPDESICLVTHNMVILTILASVLHVRLSHIRRLRQSLAAISVLNLNRGEWLVQSMNVTCHLEDGNFAGPGAF